MKKILCLLMAGCSLARADFQVAVNGKATCQIVQSADATVAEKRAAADLAKTLHDITQADFKIVPHLEKGGGHAIYVGCDAARLDGKKFGEEEFVIRVKRNRIILAGGRPRGTVYAVNRFLQDQCGVRFWTPWATTIPSNPSLVLSNTNRTVKPVFEYRYPFWVTAMRDPVWKARNQSNGEGQNIPAELGGGIEYKGFAHTFYALVEPAKLFDTHPEWFSMIKGKRTCTQAQLCLTNPKLRDYVVEQVRQWLRSAPNARIVSVTQNDCYGCCECPECKAVDDAEGSHAGTMIQFVNYIAEKIEPEFPNVAVDTFAYQYTRKPPKTVHPRPNVIVRLCSIECNFREPLDEKSNAAFMADIEEWSKICSRLYIWDYTTDFSNYLNPYPNWYTMGPNIRLFHRYGVKGVFEEGGYHSYGGEMDELRSWVLAQLLWNPQLDDRALISEFLEGYYGKPAAAQISQYMDVMYKSCKGVNLPCFLEQSPKFLNFETLAKSEKLWQAAEAAAAADPEKLLRVKIGHLPVRYALLKNWESLRKECVEKKGEWPLSTSRKAVADEFVTVCNGVPDKPWTHVDRLNEGGLSVSDFVKDKGDVVEK